MANWQSLSILLFKMLVHSTSFGFLFDLVPVLLLAALACSTLNGATATNSSTLDAQNFKSDVDLTATYPSYSGERRLVPLPEGLVEDSGVAAVNALADKEALDEVAVLERDTLELETPYRKMLKREEEEMKTKALQDNSDEAFRSLTEGQGLTGENFGLWATHVEQLYPNDPFKSLTFKTMSATLSRYEVNDYDLSLFLSQEQEYKAVRSYLIWKWRNTTISQTQLVELLKVGQDGNVFLSPGLKIALDHANRRFRRKDLAERTTYYSIQSLFDDKEAIDDAITKAISSTELNKFTATEKELKRLKEINAGAVWLKPKIDTV